jgi:hypothetical protein
VKAKSGYFFTKRKEFLSKNKQGISVTTGQFFAQKIKNCPKSYKHLRPALPYKSGLMFDPNQAFPIGAKVEISPKGFTL